MSKSADSAPPRILMGLALRQGILLLGTLLVGIGFVVASLVGGVGWESVSLEIGAAIALAGLILVFERAWSGKVAEQVSIQRDRVDGIQQNLIKKQVRAETNPAVGIGWFASYTANLHAKGTPDFDYYTAYGEIVARPSAIDGDDESVSIDWRDNLTLPSEVPLWLLQASKVHRRQADGTAPATSNLGLRNPSIGTVVTASGWALHPHRPRTNRKRAGELKGGDRAAFERLADVSRYDQLTGDRRRCAFASRTTSDPCSALTVGC